VRVAGAQACNGRTAPISANPALHRLKRQAGKCRGGRLAPGLPLPVVATGGSEVGVGQELRHFSDRGAVVEGGRAWHAAVERRRGRVRPVAICCSRV